jgi:hypothetical protein
MSRKRQPKLFVETLEARCLFAAGLVAAYGFGEGTGTAVSDLSGNGNTGTVNNATWVQGKFGTGIQFSGNSNSYLQIADSSSLPVPLPEMNGTFVL